MTVYNSEADAIRNLVASEKEMAKKFCPMAQRTCTPTCICYEPGRSNAQQGEKNKGNYLVYSPYCKHPFVEGSIVANVEN